MRLKDQRLKVMNEVLSGIKVNGILTSKVPCICFKAVFLLLGLFMCMS